MKLVCERCFDKLSMSDNSAFICQSCANGGGILDRRIQRLKEQGITFHQDPNQDRTPGTFGCVPPFRNKQDPQDPPMIPLQEWRSRDGAIWTDAEGNPSLVFDGACGLWRPIGYLNRYRDAIADIEAERARG